MTFCKQSLKHFFRLFYFAIMYAEHAEELQILHANQVSESIFQLKSPYVFSTEIKDDYRTLKVYTPDLLPESYVNFVDTYNGQTTFVLA